MAARIKGLANVAVIAADGLGREEGFSVTGPISIASGAEPFLPGRRESR